jgi:hypothetical protein
LDLLEGQVAAVGGVLKQGVLVHLDKEMQVVLVARQQLLLLMAVQAAAALVL